MGRMQHLDKRQVAKASAGLVPLPFSISKAKLYIIFNKSKFKLVAFDLFYGFVGMFVINKGDLLSRLYAVYDTNSLYPLP